MKSNSYIELKYAFFISIFNLLWLVFEKISGLQDEHLEWHWLVTSLALLIPLIGISVALREKKATKSERMTFEKGFISGLQISVICAILIIPITYLFYTLINPDWTATMMITAENDAVQNGTDIDKAVADAESHYGMVSTMIRAFLSTIIWGSIISAVVSFRLKSRSSNSKSFSN
jgi:hypothetical protein